MKRLWHGVYVAFLFGNLSFGHLACSSQEDQQQADDQVVENEQGEAQDGQEDDQGNSDQQNGEQYQDNAEGNADEGLGGENQAQAAQQQDELQEIIDGMNQQQGEGQGEGEGNIQANQGEIPPDQTAEGDQPPENANGIMPQGNPMEQQQAAAGMAAAPGLPELGSKMSYVVGRGDTLASIAMKIYGDLEKWREIAEFTGMANPNRIYPGDVIYYQLTDQTMAFGSAYEAVARTEVVVQPGDTLSTISSNTLGSSQDWKMIWRQNDNIDNPDVLTVGQTLYYVNPGMLAAAVENFRKEVQIAKTKVEIKIQVAEQTVESVKADGGELVNSISIELKNDFAALNNAGFSRVI